MGWVLPVELLWRIVEFGEVESELFLILGQLGGTCRTWREFAIGVFDRRRDAADLDQPGGWIRYFDFSHFVASAALYLCAEKADPSSTILQRAWNLSKVARDDRGLYPTGSHSALYRMYDCYASHGVSLNRIPCNTDKTSIFAAHAYFRIHALRTSPYNTRFNQASAHVPWHPEQVDFLMNLEETWGGVRLWASALCGLVHCPFRHTDSVREKTRGLLERGSERLLWLLDVDMLPDLLLALNRMRQDGLPVEIPDAHYREILKKLGCLDSNWLWKHGRSRDEFRFVFELATPLEIWAAVSEALLPPSVCLAIRNPPPGLDVRTLVSCSSTREFFERTGVDFARLVRDRLSFPDAIQLLHWDKSWCPLHLPGECSTEDCFPCRMLVRRPGENTGCSALDDLGTIALWADPAALLARDEKTRESLLGRFVRHFACAPFVDFLFRAVVFWLAEAEWKHPTFEGQAALLRGLGYRFPKRKSHQPPFACLLRHLGRQAGRFWHFFGNPYWSQTARNENRRLLFDFFARPHCCPRTHPLWAVAHRH